MPAQDKAEDRITVLRQNLERAWNNGDADAVDEVFSPDVKAHSNLLPGERPGLDGYKQSIALARRALPDLRVTAEDIIEKGDRVVVRWGLRGTHRGEAMGLRPTGNQVSFQGISIYRLAGDKVAEVWSEWDLVALLEQVVGGGQPQTAGAARGSDASSILHQFYEARHAGGASG